MSKYLKWAEVKPRDDVYTHVGTTNWGNHDLYPIPRKDKSFGWFAYFCFMICSGVCVSNYSIGSSYVAVGLTAGETIGSVLAGSVIAGWLCWIASRPGLDHSIGYTMCCRTVFGLKGTWFPICFLSIAGVVFSGLQCYYGGQAVTLMIAAIIPQFAFMSNTLPASAAITTQNIIGFFIFFLAYIPMILMIRPAQFRKFLYPGFFLVLTVMFGILIYGMRHNHGSVGPLMTSRTMQISRADKAFRVVQCIFTVIGTWGGAAERFSDWTRFAETRTAPNLAFFVGMPLGVTFSAIIGCVVTSAYYGATGEVQWNALALLQEVQLQNYTAGTRAATFFAGLSLFACQVIVNLCNNTVGWGMDMAGAFPRYLTMRRAAMLLVILSIIAQPWRFLSQATVFVQVLSVTSIFFSSSSWLMATDYFIIRKRKLVIPDLFKGNKESIYWFNGGVHYHAIVALILGMWPAIPGLAYSIMGKTNGWERMFQINYVVGAPISLISYLVFCYGISMPKGLGIQEDMPESISVIEGLSGEGSLDGSDCEKVSASAVVKDEGSQA